MMSDDLFVNKEPTRADIAYEKAVEVAAKNAEAGVRRLKLGGSTLEALDRLPPLSIEIEHLDLSRTNISNIHALSGLNNLQILELDNTKVKDISPLRSLTQLRSLTLDRSPIEDLSPLSSITSLTKLALRNIRLSDMSALAPLASLNDLSLTQTKVSNLSPFAKLSSLRRLALGGTNVSDLAPLADLFSLEILLLWDTKVADISPLANLIYLKNMNLNRTSVKDISPLAHLRRLERLSLDDTAVSDLSQLAEVTSLIRRTSGGGISFENCPLTDQTLIQLSAIDNPERTARTIAYLRLNRGLPPIQEEPQSGVDDIARLPTDLQQNKLGVRFESVGDHLAIAPSGTSTDHQAAAEAVTRQLHSVVKSRAAELNEHAARLANQPGWRAFAVASAKFNELVQNDIDFVADHIAEAWGELVSLGSFAEQDSELKNKLDGFAASLEPEQRRPLNDLLQAAAPWVRRFPTARAIDEEFAAFNALPDQLSTAREIFVAAQDEEILRNEDERFIDTALTTQVGYQSDKVRGFGILSLRNLVYETISLAARGLVVGAFTFVGHQAAKDMVLPQKAVRLIVSAEEPLRQFLSRLPADIRAAIDSLIERLKEQGDGSGIPLPKPPEIEPSERRRGPRKR